MKEQKMPETNEMGIQWYDISSQPCLFTSVIIFAPCLINLECSRVMAGNFAYLMESTSIEYTIERNCEVTKVCIQFELRF